MERQGFIRCDYLCVMGVKDKRRRDTDNFAARTKPYIDARVLAGVLEDDSRFHVLFQFSWHEAGQSETVITVT